MKKLGNLNGQQQGILGDRLKTVDRDLAKKGLAAGYRRAEFDQMRASINTDTSTVTGAGGFDQPSAAAAGSAAAGGYAADRGYGGVGSSSFGALRARGDSSILAGVGAGAGAAAAAAAGGLGSSSQAGISGLSSTAGLIHLGGQSSADGAAAAAGRGGFSRQPSAGLLATAEYNAASMQPMLLMTGTGTATAAIPAQPAMGSYQQQYQQQMGEAAGNAAAAVAVSRPGSSLATGLHLQPLQGIANPIEQRAEFEKCMHVLRGGQTDDVIEVMKLLCYELMDLQRSQAAVAAGAAGAGGSVQAQAVWGLLLERSDELVQLLTGQTQQVGVTLCSSCYFVF
jgi:hypothetical protein